jgi:O-acetyl-ADP-ribose deacetylase (regulator of RNase III)
MEAQLRLCLEKAVKDNMSSIAFPALGCGNLKYDPCAVAKAFLKAEEACGQQLEV